MIYLSKRSTDATGSYKTVSHCRLFEHLQRPVPTRSGISSSSKMATGTLSRWTMSVLVLFCLSGALACANRSVFKCDDGAVVVTYGLDGSNTCGITVKPIPVCTGTDCKLADNGSGIQVQKNNAFFAGCTPFLASSRRCIAWCRDVNTGGIHRGSYFCESTSIGDAACGGTCASACSRYNP